MSERVVATGRLPKSRETEVGGKHLCLAPLESIHGPVRLRNCWLTIQLPQRQQGKRKLCFNDGRNDLVHPVDVDTHLAFSDMRIVYILYENGVHLQYKAPASLGRDQKFAPLGGKAAAIPVQENVPNVYGPTASSSVLLSYSTQFLEYPVPQKEGVVL